MRPALSICLLALAAAQAPAQELEELVVTASLMESEVPGKHLRRNADNLMLRVQIVNDAREENQREDEIHETLLAAIAAAAKRDMDFRRALSRVRGRWFAPTATLLPAYRVGTGRFPRVDGRTDPLDLVTTPGRLLLDLKILARTAPVVLVGRGAS